MTYKTAKINNGVIALPRDLLKSWNGAEVFVRSSDDTIVIKKLQKAAFWSTWEKVGKLGKKNSQREVNDAVTWARKRQK